MSTTLASTLLSSSIAIGPQGVQGTAGYIGADGAQGVQGALGGDPYWNTISSNTQAVPFGRYVTNSQTGSFTITLPSSPETGNYIQIADVGYWGTNNVTVARNGNLIEGLADDLILDATGTFIELIYTGTSWELVSSLGRRGVQGAQGLQGVQGVQGIQGDFGVQGVQGIQGLQGPQSTQGIQGIRGDIIYQESLSNLTNSTGTVVHNTAINSIWVHSSISGNITVNFTNVNTTDNTILTFLVILLQGATARSLSAVQIDGVAQTINWFDNVVPTATINKKEFYTFNLLRTSNAWTVMGSMASYG